MTHALDQIAAAQDECRAESPRVAREILRAHFPHKTDSFFKRHLPLLLTLSPEDLIKTIGYPDPTGETAVRRILAQTEVYA